MQLLHEPKESSLSMAAYSPNDVVQAVVADLGQGQTKMGFAGEDYPRSYFRSVR